MSTAQKEMLTYLHYVLKLSINDKSAVYEHSIEEDGMVENIKVNREQHLEEVMEFVVQELEKHFDLNIQ